MKSAYDAIYIAPHLDDAVLSCGGQIAASCRAGYDVLVATVMAGDASASPSAYAQSLRERWGLPARSEAARRAEDRRACALLGADVLHWPLPDCIYRTDAVSGAPFYRSDAEIFGPVQSGDEGLVEQVIELLGGLPPAGRLCAPLGAGHHVDHVIVGRAARRVYGAGLLFYEDYPYAQEEGRVAASLEALGGPWHRLVIPLDEAALAAKIEAILAYRSQLSTFWTDRADLEAQVRGYADANGGEALWQRRADHGQTG